jgi:hypothetical protein
MGDKLYRTPIKYTRRGLSVATGTGILQELSKNTLLYGRLGELFSATDEFLVKY